MTEYHFGSQHIFTSRSGASNIVIKPGAGETLTLLDTTVAQLLPYKNILIGDINGVAVPVLMGGAGSLSETGTLTLNPSLLCRYRLAPLNIPNATDVQIDYQLINPSQSHNITADLIHALGVFTNNSTRTLVLSLNYTTTFSVDNNGYRAIWINYGGGQLGKQTTRALLNIETTVSSGFNLVLPPSQSFSIVVRHTAGNPVTSTDNNISIIIT